jgi:MFS family permease
MVAPATAPQSPRTEQKAALGVIFLVVFLDLLGFGIVIPQLGIYGVKFGASGAVIGLLGSAYSLMQFLASPLLGRLSDQVGRRPVLLLSLGGSIVGYLIFGLANSIWLLFLGRLVQGLAGANISTAQAYIADTTPPELRAKRLGMVLGGAFGLGFTFGPAVGSLLVRWGNLGLGLAAAAMSALALAVAFFKLPESLPPEARQAQKPAEGRLGRVGEVLALPGVARVSGVFVLATFAFSMMEGTFSLYLLTRFFGGVASATMTELAASGDVVAQQAGKWTGGIFVTIGLVATVVQGGLIGPLRARYGEARLVVVGAALLSLSLTGIALVPTLGLLFPVVAVLAMGNGLSTPSLSSLISQVAPKGRQGEVIGTYQGLGSLARTLGPTVGGVLFQQVGQSAPFLLAGVLMAAAVLLALRLGPEVAAASARDLTAS